MVLLLQLVFRSWPLVHDGRLQGPGCCEAAYGPLLSANLTHKYSRL